jgi:DNA-binding NarL/FixJ family response regulator
MIRVVIIDDHPLYRQGLAMAVERAEDFTLVTDAAWLSYLISAIRAFSGDRSYPPGVMRPVS